MAGQGLTGRLGIRLPTPLSGVRVPNERLPLLAEPRLLAPSPKILNRGLGKLYISNVLKANYFRQYMKSFKRNNNNEEEEKAPKLTNFMQNS